MWSVIRRINGNDRIIKIKTNIPELPDRTVLGIIIIAILNARG